MLALFMGLCGCGAVPLSRLDDPRALEVKIGGLSTRVFHAGQNSRFSIRIGNRSGRAVLIDALEVKLQAVGEGNSPDRIDRSWPYTGFKSAVLEPGKLLDLELVPEPQEFPLGRRAPGRYQIVATVCDRFVSDPFVVRVESRRIAP